MAKKSWADKMRTPEAPYVAIAEHKRAGILPGQKMLIPTPVLVRDYIDKIPEGKTKSMLDMRADLAKEFDADTTCPMVSGIFLRIASEDAWQQHLEGKSLEATTPFWRMIEPKSKVAQKLACGVEFIRAQRSKEGLD